MNWSKAKRRRGVTMVEALVVLSVVAFAVSLMGPLIVDSVRKSRQTQCANNLREIGLAWSEHEQAQNFLPSSGWGWRWVGDPDRGFGRKQPGGWAYDVARFSAYSHIIEEGMGRDTDEERGAAMLKAVSTPMPLFYCPGRRPVSTYPVIRNGDLANNLRECKAPTCHVTRSDYQANSGNVLAGETGGPVGDRSFSDIPSPYTSNHTGVTHHVSEIRLAQVQDGLSKTICVGEKYLMPDAYTTGSTPGDDQSAFSGIDRELNGYTATTTRPRISLPDSERLVISELLPRRDRPGLSLNWTFGSSHQAGFNVVNCDTSVKFLSYDINHVVFWRMGGRADGP